MSHGFPTAASEIDAAWLTTPLRSTGTIGDGVAVAAFEADPIGVGIGILSLLWQITLEHQGGTGPATAVLKLPHTAAGRACRPPCRLVGLA
jgi:hypothetical protein